MSNKSSNNSGYSNYSSSSNNPSYPGYSNNSNNSNYTRSSNTGDYSSNWKTSFDQRTYQMNDAQKLNYLDRQQDIRNGNSYNRY
jgi:hypothetical protein